MDCTRQRHLSGTDLSFITKGLVQVRENNKTNIAYDIYYIYYLVSVYTFVVSITLFLLGMICTYARDGG